MSVKILSGKEIAEKKFLEITNQIAKGKSFHKELPGLAVLMVGNDPASLLYIKNKKKACHKTGIIFHDYYFQDCSEAEIIEVINFLNNDAGTCGIIVQLPLLKGFNTEKIIQSISPQKDVDGFHLENLEKFNFCNTENTSDIVFPPTLKAILTLLDSIKKPLKNKTGVIISKNEIFAAPLKKLLELKGVKTDIISPDNRKIKTFDIIISAVGKPEFLKGDMIKRGVIIIDVGITLAGTSFKGDVDFDSCAKRASYISPVPGGVGPLTVAYLLENVVKAWK